MAAQERFRGEAGWWMVDLEFGCMYSCGEAIEFGGRLIIPSRKDVSQVEFL